MNKDFDFGFTAVDADELEGITTTSVDNTDIVVNEVSSEVTEKIAEQISGVESKINAVILKLEELGHVKVNDNKIYIKFMCTEDTKEKVNT